MRIVNFLALVFIAWMLLWVTGFGNLFSVAR